MSELQFKRNFYPCVVVVKVCLIRILTRNLKSTGGILGQTASAANKTSMSIHHVCMCKHVHLLVQFALLYN